MERKIQNNDEMVIFNVQRYKIKAISMKMLFKLIYYFIILCIYIIQSAHIHSLLSCPQPIHCTLTH